jgi:hypothetical protein
MYREKIYGDRRLDLAKKEIELDFGSFTLDAKLFDTGIAEYFAEHLPYTVNLIQWGKELYGSIGIDLGEESPVTEIPPGGIAYTKDGRYVCIFFGQRPAWGVEYIGRISDDDWKKLLDNPDCGAVVIRAR